MEWGVGKVERRKVTVKTLTDKYDFHQTITFFIVYYYCILARNCIQGNYIPIICTNDKSNFWIIRTDRKEPLKELVNCKKWALGRRSCLISCWNTLRDTHIAAGRLTRWAELSDWGWGRQWRHSWHWSRSHPGGHWIRTWLGRTCAPTPPRTAPSARTAGCTSGRAPWSWRTQRSHSPSQHHTFTQQAVINFRPTVEP